MHLLWKAGLVCVPVIVLGVARQGGHQAQPRSSALAKWSARDVAGSYYFGDGLGENCRLIISRDSTFQFKWTGCLGVYGKNEGPVHFEGDELVLDPTQDNSKKFGGTATRFYPVRWGNRMYLIAEEDMLGFCTAIGRGWNGTEVLGVHGDHYIREDILESDLQKPAQGKPQIPSKFLPWTQQKMYVLVTKIEGNRYFVDKGSEDGVSKGVKLIGYGSGFDQLVIDNVDAHSAAGHLDNMQKTKGLAPRVGSKLIAFDIELLMRS